jgi:Ca2+/Na+ antiporter
MVTIGATTQLLTIILSIAGILLIVRIHTMKYGVDSATLRARAFLDESFLRDSWRLLLASCTLFLFHAAFELTGLLEAPIDESSLIAVLLDEVTELGVLVCIFILVYKWLKLVSPQRSFERKE